MKKTTSQLMTIATGIALVLGTALPSEAWFVKTNVKTDVSKTEEHVGGDKIGGNKVTDQSTGDRVSGYANSVGNTDLSQGKITGNSNITGHFDVRELTDSVAAGNQNMDAKGGDVTAGNVTGQLSNLGGMNMISGVDKSHDNTSITTTNFNIGK